jgi:hypothetical protein
MSAVTSGAAMEVLLDAILGVFAIEAVALGLYHRATGRGIAPRVYLPNLAAGFFILAAARVAVGGGPLVAIPFCLLAALGAHVLDFAGRWNGRE